MTVCKKGAPMSIEMNVDRRTLVGAAAVTGAVAALSCTTSTVRADEPTWDGETDIVVVGSGFTGMVAAIAALDEGASVMVFEQDDHPGGNSILCDANGQFGGGTSFQEALGIDDTPEAFYDEIMAHGHFKSNPTLLRSFTDHAVEMVEWLQGIGVVFNDSLKKQEMSIERTHQAAPYADGIAGGLALWRYLDDALTARGGEVKLSHRVTRLIQDPDGTVLGVELEAENGPMRFKANKGVVIAAGGWKGNVAMRTAWDPRWDGETLSSGFPCTESNGAMINAAVDAGGAVCGMGTIGETLFKWGIDTMVDWTGDIDTMPDYYTTGVGIDPLHTIAVDGRGLRFVDETCALDYGTPILPDAYLSLPDRPRNVWGITDTAGAEAAGWSAEAFENPSLTGMPKLKPGWACIADTLEELAELMGVDPEGLVQTVDRYNGFAEAGADEDFGKIDLTPIVEPPFYGAKFQLYCHDQMSGLVANTKGQVVKRSSLYGPEALDIDEYEVIPRLYAAGESVGGYWGDSRGHGKISAYMLQGRNAARDAAALEALPSM